MIEPEYDCEDMDAFYASHPVIKPGRITYADLKRINAWGVEQGLDTDRSREIEAYRDEGYRAADAGLRMGLIDYGQASGEVD